MNTNRHDPLEQKIHLPDRLFLSGIQEVYGVNRGVYNTIDLWFYEQGLNDLMMRRRIILDFLYKLQIGISSQEKRVKFGPGRLTEKLTEYWSNNIHHEPFLIR